MSAQTIRDVVVRIALEQSDAKLRAPDLSAWHSAVKEMEDRINRMKQQASTVGGMGGSSEKKAAVSEEVAAEAAAHKAKLEMLTNYRKEDALATQQSLDNVRRLTAAQNNYAQHAQQQLRAARMQQLEAFGALSGSIAQFARGTAFLFASTDDDMRKYLETIAKYQGVFDLIAGGTGTLKNAINLWTALSVAQNASAAAGTRAALANAAGSAGSAAGSVASSAAGSFAGDLAGRAAMGLSRFALPAAAVASVGYIGYQSYLESEVRPGERRRSAEEEARRERVRQAEEYNNTVLRRLQSRRTGTDLTESLIGAGALTNSQAMEQLRANQSGIDFQYNVMSRGQIDNLAGPSYAKDAELLVEYSEQSIRNFERLIQLGNQNADSLRQQALNYESIADASRKQLEQEQQRYESLEEKIGRLTEADVARLKRIAEAQKDGKPLSLDDARYLESQGVGTELARSRFRQEANARGAIGILEPLGELERFNKAKASDASIQSSAKESIERLTKEIDKVIQQRDQDIKSLEAAFLNVFAGRSELQELLSIVQKLQQNEQRRVASQR